MVRRSARRRPAHRWRLETERLEDRSVPAGNVLAEQVGNTLTLIGDDLNNQIRLIPGSQPNEVVVQGDSTTVNGSADPQVFTGVENLFAHMLKGNDSLQLIGVNISSPGFSQVFVDGNAGSDRIELIDTTIHAVGSVDLQIYGDRVFGEFDSGATGNDTIRILNSSLTANAFVSVRLVGETNNGGVVTGGNDEITIADSNLIAEGGFFHQVSIEIYGEINTSLGGQTSTIGGGNDKISITGTTIVASSELFNFSFQNIISVTIVGDFNDVHAIVPETFTGEDAAGSIGGGNDSIDVTDTSMSVRGVNFGTSQTGMTIIGDRNFVSGFLADDTTSATIGGGNDSINVIDSSLSTTGGPSNGSFVEIRGEDIQVAGPDGASTTSTIGGGSDRINVMNTPIFARGEFASGAALVIFGDFVNAFLSGVSIIGAGNDRVNVHNLQLPDSTPNDFFAIIVDAGIGDDRVEITNSSARFFIVHLGEGDDTLTFNSNQIGEEASLDGGAGFDRLTALGNTGLLIQFGFEDVEMG
jgi:hypothetical protein